MVLLTKVVVRLLPFQRTTDEATKFVPVAVSVKAPLPTAAVLGAMELKVGTGLLWAVAEPTLATRTPRRTTKSTDSRRLPPFTVRRKCLNHPARINGSFR